MRILALWLVNYYSGNGDQFFRKSLEELGTIDVIPLDSKSCSSDLIKAVESKKYDFLIHIPYRDTIRGETIEYCSQFVKTIAWQGDDEWLWSSDLYHSPKNIAKFYNYNVTTDLFSIPRYQEIGYKNVILAQWGYGIEWVYKKTKPEFDVYFCGAATTERDYYLKSLLSKGFSVGIDGPGYGWHTNKNLKTYPSSVPGKIPKDVMIDRYRKAKIAINFNFGAKDGKAYEQVKARTFEIPAVGPMQIVNDSPSIDRFFKRGKEVITFDSREDLLSKINYYLKHEDKRQEIADAGRKRNEPYNYIDIFKRVFKEAK